MTIATLKIEDTSKLEFQVSITGASGVAESRFIIENKDYSISYPCKTTNEGVEVQIGNLKNVLESGEHAVRLEVILENKIYTPLKDTIVFLPATEVENLSTAVKPTNESVTVNKVVIKNSVITEDILRKTQAAMIIANVLKYIPENKETPLDIIKNAISSVKTLTVEQKQTVEEMLKLAESTGIEVDVTLLENIHAEDLESDKDDSGWSDKDIDDHIAGINDWDDIIDAYSPEELGLIDSDTGEEIDGDLKDELKEDTLNEVLSRVERIKARIRFARTAGKRERKMQIALKKHSTMEVIKKRARHLAVKTMEVKLAKGKPLATLGVKDKERIERIIERRSALIGRITTKLIGRVKGIERARLSHTKYTAQ
jgi:hypothetical protein